MDELNNDTNDAFWSEPREEQNYVLKLYVTGMTPRSTEAIHNIKSICEQYLQGRYSLEVVDIYQQPHLAAGDQIIATPTLVKKLPAPLRRFIGDLSATDKILLGLNLRVEPMPSGVDSSQKNFE